MANDMHLENARDSAVSDRATAILAACYALTFTSLYMGDPVSHVLILVRGCASLAQRMLQAGLNSPLFPPNELISGNDPHRLVVRKQLYNAQPLPFETTAAARESLNLVECTCQFQSFEQDILQRMKSIVGLTCGPIDGMTPPCFLTVDCGAKIPLELTSILCSCK